MRLERERSRSKEDQRGVKGEKRLWGGGGDGGDGTIRGREKPFLPSASALAIPWGGGRKGVQELRV